MIDFSSVDSSFINKMALILGGTFFGVLIVSLFLGKVLLFLRLPKWLVQRFISLVGALGFIYAVVYVGELFL